MVTLYDNGSQDVLKDEISRLLPFANKEIKHLVNEHENLLVFPYCLQDAPDNIGHEKIFEYSNSRTTENVNVKTGNIIGFIGKDGQTLRIKSRFDKDRNDYLIHYMLLRVFASNIFNLPHSIDNEEVFDFLMFLFPTMLRSALNQGFYREYRRFSYNDANVKGSIDVARHIRENIPFAGNIAYTMREHTSDNSMMQLIRHTIEFMLTRKLGHAILSMSRDIADDVNLIRQITPTYNQGERMTIVNKNLRPNRHPYYTAYYPLQKLCIQILRMEEIKYGFDEKDVHGILFDAAWLWEEYVNTIVQQAGFRHPQNRENKGSIYLFANKTGRRFPDFIKPGIILDAKYKHLLIHGQSNITGFDRNDIHQIIAYMYVERALHGGFVFPFEGKDEAFASSELRGYGGEIGAYGIPVSKEKSSFERFGYEMESAEKAIIKRLNTLT